MTEEDFSPIPCANCGDFTGRLNLRRDPTPAWLCDGCYDLDDSQLETVAVPVDTNEGPQPCECCQWRIGTNRAVGDEPPLYMCDECCQPIGPTESW